MFLKQRSRSREVKSERRKGKEFITRGKIFSFLSRTGRRYKEDLSKTQAKRREKKRKN